MIPSKHKPNASPRGPQSVSRGVSQRQIRRMNGQRATISVPQYVGERPVAPAWIPRKVWAGNQHKPARFDREPDTRTRPLYAARGRAITRVSGGRLR